MSKFSDTLAQFEIKEQRLLSKKSNLISKWKKRVGDIGEKTQLFAFSDPVIAGIFLEAQLAFKNNPAQVKVWEESGKIFFKSRRGSTLPTATEKNSGKHSSPQKTNIEG